VSQSQKPTLEIRLKLEVDAIVAILSKHEKVEMVASYGVNVRSGGGGRKRSDDEGLTLVLWAVRAGESCRATAFGNLFGNLTIWISATKLC
jgi:hypothetical protein